MTAPLFNRRDLLRTAAIGAAAPVLAAALPQPASAAPGSPAAAASTGSQSVIKKATLFKSALYTTFQEKLPLVEKFKILKDLGFDGTQLTDPFQVDLNEAREAVEKTGFLIHGSWDPTHWQIRLSDPDPAVREKAYNTLIKSLQRVHELGGSAVLLVPGAVHNAKTENPQQVWERSTPLIAKAIPVAAKLGVRIGIENVWNGFLYDPKGGGDQMPDELIKYVDQFNNPWLGQYFDIGNHRKFAHPEKWIRALGPRIIKLHAKGYSMKHGFCKIGDGDIDWAAVRAALDDIGFCGYVTAEVGGGDRKRMAEISQRLDKYLLGK